MTAGRRYPAPGEFGEPSLSVPRDAVLDHPEITRLRARVDELLAANNAEVERRRRAEQHCEMLNADLEVLNADRAALRDEVARLGRELWGDAEVAEPDADVPDDNLSNAFVAETRKVLADRWCKWGGISSGWIEESSPESAIRAALDWLESGETK